jgi:23S rRNA (uridine2552-2'-O)-methyltransferase
MAQPASDSRRGKRSGGARVRGGKRWMDEHVADPYVQQARRAGYRSRAAFKLLELDDKHRLFRVGQVVVDLGAAPGSWSQVARARVGRTGTVVALDLLALDPIDGVASIQGDARAAETQARLAALLKKGNVDLVLSDMSPNLSGVAAADAAQGAELVEIAADFAVDYLKPIGSLVVKVFHGAGFEEALRLLRSRFGSVSVRKPAASRGRSTEVYVIAARPYSAR